MHMYTDPDDGYSDMCDTLVIRSAIETLVMDKLAMVMGMQTPQKA